MVKPAQGTRDSRRLPAVRASGWEEEQVLPLGWEDRLHLPHVWAADQQCGRSNGTFPGDGEPGTVNRGRSRIYSEEQTYSAAA